MLIYRKDKSIPESVKKEREICASVAIAPQSTKVVGTAEQELRWDGESTPVCVEDVNKKCVPVTETVVPESAEPM